MTVVGVTAKPRQAAVLARGSGNPAKHASRSLTEGGAKVAASIYERENLRAGDTFRGPSVVEASDTTVYVPGGYSGSVDRLGNLLIERD